MADDEMNFRFGFERLEVWRFSLDAMEVAHRVANRLPARYAELAEQIRDASQSMCGNLAEGVGKEGRDQIRFFMIARGSTYETAGRIEMAYTLKLIDAELRLTAREKLRPVAAILTRLTRPR